MTYNYSFSGTDVKAYASNIEGENFHQLKALSTISIQVNEQKSPVRRLGRQHVTSFTRSIKTVAGTMVFVILNDHPLKGLIANGNLYLNSRHVLNDINQKYQSTNILPFNLKLIYQTEHATNNTAEINVYGIEVISQSIVTSSNDMVTEMVIQFLAKDYKEFYHSGIANQRLAEDTMNAENEYVRQEDILNQMNLENIYNEEQIQYDIAEQENQLYQYQQEQNAIDQYDENAAYSDYISKENAYKQAELTEQGYQDELNAYAKEKELENDIALGQKILDDYLGNKTNSNNVTKSQRIQAEDIFKLQENAAGKLVQENAQAQARIKQERIKELENKKLNLLMTYYTLKMNPNAKPEVLQGYENSINFIKNQLQKLRAI
jgi:hypothetical protein